MEIRALRPGDDRSAFHCGDPDLDSFLQKYAVQNQFRHHIGTTYVAVERERIVGYLTVSPGQIDADSIPTSTRKSLPSYPLPILRLARLAVDAAAQGLGVGHALLRFSFRLSVRLADEFGCVGVVVDAAPPAADFYRRLGFMELDVLEGRSATRPQPITMFLPVRELKKLS